MENVVLGLLMIQNMTLYDLNRAFSQGISMFYSASYGSLQAAVKNLLARGWIVFEETVEHGRNKKIYSITPDGRQAFLDWMIEEIPANKLEVVALSRVYFLGLVPEAAKRRQVVSLIVERIEQVQAELQQMDTAIRQMDIPAGYQELLKYQLRTLDYGIRSHAFGKQWFQELLKDL